MKPLSSLIAIATLWSTTQLLAQSPSDKPNLVEKPAGTSLTLSGILIKEVGTKVNLGPHRSIIVLDNTKTNGEPIIIYHLVTPDGIRVGFGRQALATAPAKLDSFVNQSCTIQGICTVMEARPGLGKLINFDAITRVTQEALPPTAEQLEAARHPGKAKHASTNLTCSGTPP